jgi:hypothetical protein
METRPERCNDAHEAQEPWQFMREELEQLADRLHAEAFAECSLAEDAEAAIRDAARHAPSRSAGVE